MDADAQISIDRPGNGAAPTPACGAALMKSLTFAVRRASPTSSSSTHRSRPPLSAAARRPRPHAAAAAAPDATIRSGAATGRPWIAYRLSAPPSLRRRVCRPRCVPNLLLVLLIVLFGVATLQVALFHYFGVSGGSGSAHSLLANPYVLRGGAAAFVGRLDAPAPRINLQSLLSRNVPSIANNFRHLHQQINEQTLNSLLAREERRAAVTALNQSSPNSTFRSLLPACPDVPPDLRGHIFADANHTHEENYTEEAVAAANEGLSPGGAWRPARCHSRHHVAIVVPYRDRRRHLLTLLAHLHPVLRRQQLDYRVFVVEQRGNRTFNKARIMNIAFVEALRRDASFGCFVFHDVDLIPEDDRNLYTCPEHPRHMSVAIDEMNYQIPYEQLVGGVFAIRTAHFFAVNGYSNLYWGWGAEDDDMAYRLEHIGLRITRPPNAVARYKMIRHTKRPAVDGRIRYRLLWTAVRRYRIDGINSLNSLKYTIVSITERPLYTHILVDIGLPPPGF